LDEEREENLKKAEKKFWVHDITELYKFSLLILERLKEKFPQYHLNAARNMWIMKPGG